MKKNSDYALESTSSDGSGSVIQYDEALKESGLAELRKKQQEKNAAKFSKPSTKLTEYQQSMYQSNIRTCPVCGKQFSPAPQHIYKDKRGRLCCNYTCARKGGWNG